MKVVLINKYYYRRRGGETSFFDVKDILEKNGHTVIPFSMHHPDNEETPWSTYFVSHLEYTQGTLFSLIAKGLKSLYSLEARSRFSKLIEETRPDIVHIHNIYHHLSPSILDVCRNKKIPVVQTVHDYKLVCPNYRLFAHGKVNEECKKSLWRDFLHRTHKRSFIQSFAVCFESWLHRVLGSWKKGVSHWISPSYFVRNKLIEFGMPADRISVIHHSVNPLQQTEKVSNLQPKNGVAYIGALSEEKGIETLIEALHYVDTTLHIYGDGPHRTFLEHLANDSGVNDKIVFHGFIPRERLLVEIQKHACVVVPSRWYEVFGYVVLESYAVRLPVIAARIGALPEVTCHSDLLFEPGNAYDLAQKIFFILQSPERCQEYGLQGKAHVENFFSPDVYYLKLRDIYNKILDKSFSS
ncbi:glycosyltransferase [Candidatus Uhrbacteria bacterium]|nr:glycosyltransferase [Candidatus Uhrbacteria bacterium]